MTVLVTGGAGYIGSHTVRALRGRGREVVVLDNLSNGREDAVLGSPLVVGDIDDGLLVEKVVAEYEVDSVHPLRGVEGRRRVHGAAGALLRQQRVRLGDADRRLAAVRRRPVRLLLLGRGVRHSRPEPRSTRSTPLHPESVYGETKVMVERMLHWFDATRRDALGQPPLLQRRRRVVRRADRRGLRHHPEPRAGADEGPARQAAAARGLRHRLPHARRHRRPRLHPRRGPGRGPRARARVPRPGRRHHRAQPRHGQGLQRPGGPGRRASHHRPGRAGHVAPRRAGDPEILVADTTRAMELLGWQPRLGLDDIISSAWQWHSAHPDGFGRG